MSNDFDPTVVNNGMETDFNEANLPRFADIDPESATPEQVSEVVKAAQTLLAQQRHWKQKALSLQAPKPAPAPTQPQRDVPDDLTDTVKKLELAEEKRQFAYSHNLNPAETDHLYAFAKGAGLTPKEALEHPFFKKGLEGIRQSDEVNSAIPKPSGRRPIIEGKTLTEMSPEERKKNWSSIVASSRR